VRVEVHLTNHRIPAFDEAAELVFRWHGDLRVRLGRSHVFTSPDHFIVLMIIRPVPMIARREPIVPALP
jgi:hypothetical protein